MVAIGGAMHIPVRGEANSRAANLLVEHLRAAVGRGAAGGTVRRPLGAPISIGPCLAFPSLIHMTEVDTIPIFAVVDCGAPAPGVVDSASVAATMKGALVPLGPLKFDQAGGESTDTEFAVHPCSLPGGSDLPGAILTYEYVVDIPKPVKVFTFHYTLPDDKAPPVLTASSTPPGGTKVVPGQVITVHITATEPNGQGPQTGIQGIRLTGPQGLIDRASYGDRPTACDTSRLAKTLTTTYTVPDKPPAIIHLSAVARDFAHNQSADLSADFPTTGVPWTGTIGATTTRRYVERVGGQYSCHDAWKGKLFLVVLTNNTITGSGTMNKTALSCDFPYGIGDVTPATAVSFSVSGTKDETGLNLVLGFEAINGVSLAGVSSLLNNAACSGPNFKPFGPTLRVLFTDFSNPRHASGSPQVRTTMGSGCGASGGADRLTAQTVINLTRATQ